MSEPSEKPNAAPYVPFSTFISALDNVAANSVPNFIDRHCFTSFSGAAVAGALSSFRFFGLIDANGKPEKLLHDIAMDKGDTERKRNIKALLEKHYAGLIALDLSRTTPSEFDREFSSEHYGVNGDTRVKAKTFFIKAAQFAEIPISKLLLKKARGPRKPKKAKDPGAIIGQGVAASKGGESEQHTGGSHATKIVRLHGGGTVMLTASVDVLSLKGKDREFVFNLIDLLSSYESGEDIPAQVLP
jgi:hypothetical protein